MRIIFLTRNLKAIVKKVNPKQNHYVWRNGVYVLSFPRIQNWVSETGFVRGSEIIFFEDNPNALKHEDNDQDSSAKFLNEIVAKNVIDQTTDKFGFKFPKIPLVGWIADNPIRLFWIFVFGTIIWTFLKEQILGLIGNV